jgi:3',5'-cyclic AMP phosphodiesterase CpdA
MTVVVQLSDTHLVGGDRLAYGKIDTLGALRRAAAQLRVIDAQTGGIDAIVVTGDLTDHGEPEAYESFREALAWFDRPLLVLPGNHDLREPMRAAFPGLPAAGPLDHVARVGALSLVMLDTLLEGEPYGSLSEAQLAWLDDTLTAEAGRPVLLFLHHPPFPTGIAFMDANGLRAPEGLEAVVSRHPGIQLVGCGHVHRSVTVRWAGVPGMIAPAPAHAIAMDLRPDGGAGFIMEPGGVLVHRWDGERLISQTAFTDAWAGPVPFF